MAAWRCLLSALVVEGLIKMGGAEQCPGKFKIKGYDQPAELVGATYDIPGKRASKVEVVDGHLVPNLKGRAYFANACTPGSYDYKQYMALKLLGKTLRYTTNISGASCGCNTALYLTSLAQNPEKSDCEDYYCDANSVCGVACSEIDIQEANQFAWRSTFHAATDAWGIGKGYGGGLGDWTKEEYGPNGSCVDTDVPFQVAVSFPVDKHRQLKSMNVTLSQKGKPCNLSIGLAGYDGNATIAPKGSLLGMQEMTKALDEGMTPMISLWEATDMTWLDGLGPHKNGPCAKDIEDACPETIRFYDFSVIDLEEVQWVKTFLISLGVVAIVCAIAFLGLYFYNPDDHALLEEDEDESSE